MTVDFNSKAYLDKVDAWWRAANYISAAQMYLKDNPLLKREVVENDLKAHPIGHWGTVPGQNFIYAHLNRAINKYDLDMFYIERTRSWWTSYGVQLLLRWFLHRIESKYPTK